MRPQVSHKGRMDTGRPELEEAVMREQRTVEQVQGKMERWRNSRSPWPLKEPSALGLQSPSATASLLQKSGVYPVVGDTAEP